LPHDDIARALHFIEAQRRPDGLWEYDPALGIPPDADSTACAMAALVLNGASLDRAEAADLLRSFWRADLGPFRSWRVAGMWSAPERDDPVVNCNIVLALRALGSPASTAEQDEVLRLLRRSGQGSRYYWAPSTIVHAARRAGLDPSALPPAAVARPEPRDLLGAAQWLCGMSEHAPELIAGLLAAQRADGSWPLWPWVTGAGNPRPFWGSAAITTALAVEALDAHP
jgi:hypothetical protein